MCFGACVCRFVFLLVQYVYVWETKFNLLCGDSLECLSKLGSMCGFSLSLPWTHVLQEVQTYCGENKETENQIKSTTV